jgi:intracellular sulfur oxidation DsrE/DsrF family protein
MTNPYNIDELMLAAFVDGQLDTEHSQAIIEAMDNDLDIRDRVYNIRKAKDLIKLGFEDTNLADSGPLTVVTPPFWRQYCSTIAASITALAISFGAGIGVYHFNQLSDQLSSQNVASAGQYQFGQELPDHIILHISESDPRLFESSLNFTESFLKKYQKTGGKIEVVANAGGIDLMRADYPLGDKVMEMMAKYDNVTFVACTNAIKRLRQQGIQPMIIKDVETDSAAMDHILDRVREGWTYMKASDAQKMMI